MIFMPVSETKLEIVKSKDSILSSAPTEWDKIESSLIQATAYDPTDGSMYVAMNYNPLHPNIVGNVYVYKGISQVLYDEFLKSDSKGRYFNTIIKPSATDYDYLR